MKEFLKGLCLSLLVGAYPIVFLYGHNAANLIPESLVTPLGLTLLAAAVAYGLFYLFQRKAASASLSTIAFLLLYYFYGSIDHLLLQPDKYPIYHFVLLPVLLFVAFYIGYFIAKIKTGLVSGVQSVLLFAMVIMVAYNVVIILPVEWQMAHAKPAASQAASTTASAAKNMDVNKKYPDIYYIIFDEYERFDIMHTYWHNDDVDQFDAFLKQNHFFVVTNTRTATINTQIELSSRLNLQQYNEQTDVKVTLAALDNNKVMQVLKSYGYTTASLDMSFPNIDADYHINYDPQDVAGMAVDEFRQTFLDDTMANAFLGYFQDVDTSETKQRDLILYTLNQIPNLSTLKSPKFVFSHVLLPHMPFIFDKDGNLQSAAG